MLLFVFSSSSAHDQGSTLRLASDVSCLMEIHLKLILTHQKTLYIVGLAIMMTDVYQTPVILAEGLFSEIKGFFSEAVRGKNELPFNHVTSTCFCVFDCAFGASK